MEMKPHFVFFCDWGNCPDKMLRSCFSEFHDNGISELVFIEPWVSRIMTEPRFFGMLKNLAGSKVSFTEMHALYGECYDLACTSRFRRDDMIKDHIRAIGCASDIGCRTYTIHIGAYDSVFFHVPNDVLRPLALEALEKLIPAAEKYGVVLAVENAFERANTPMEVMYYVNYFNHPNVKACFDNGHAHIMDIFPGKNDNAYGSYMTDDVWSGKIEHCTNAFELMSPATVTCHLHDNNGFSDQHLLPGMGSVDWDETAKKLLTQAPNLISIQTEAEIFSSGASITDAVRRFRRIFPTLL